MSEKETGEKQTKRKKGEKEEKEKEPYRSMLRVKVLHVM